MESITREDLELMAALQATETEAANIETVLEGLPVQAAVLEKELEELAGFVASRKNQVAELKKMYRMREADFEASQERIKKRNIQLHSVKSNKDYQAILKEIEEIKAAASAIEDDMLKGLDDIEAAEAGLAEVERQYADRKAVIEREKRELEEKAAAEREKIQQLHVRIREIADQLDPKLKKRYYNIKAKSGGIAIVPVNGGICKGCHLNIPPQLYNELHKENELRLCPHCYRIIYVL